MNCQADETRTRPRNTSPKTRHQKITDLSSSAENATTQTRSAPIHLRNRVGIASRKEEFAIYPLPCVAEGMQVKHGWAYAARRPFYFSHERNPHFFPFPWRMALNAIATIFLATSAHRVKDKQPTRGRHPTDDSDANGRPPIADRSSWKHCEPESCQQRSDRPNPAKMGASMPPKECAMRQKFDDRRATR